MRRAGAIIIALCVLISTPVVFANIAIDPINLPGLKGSGAYCEVPYETSRLWTTHTGTMHLYPGKDCWESFPPGGEFGEFHGWNFKVDGLAKKQDGGEPILKDIGFGSVSPLVTTAVVPNDPLVGDAVIQRGAICADAMTLKFEEWTNSPETDEDFRMIFGQDDDSSSSCGSRVLSRYNPDLTSRQGWTAGTTSNTQATAFKLPLFCEQVRFTIKDPQASDWSNMVGTWNLPDDFSTIGTGEWRREWHDGGNYLGIRAKYDQDTLELSDYTIIVDDQGTLEPNYGGEGSSATGGFGYEISCLGAPDPEDHAPYCETVGEWVPAGSSAQDGSCCYAETQGDIGVFEGVDHICLESEDGYRWTRNIPVDCTTGEPGVSTNGQRLINDPAGYCCAEESTFADKPHLYDGTSFVAENPGATKRYWCDANGELNLLSAKGDWSFSEQNGWVQCKEDSLGTRNEQHLCAYDGTEALWETCRCQDGGDTCGPSQYNEHLDPDWFCAPAQGSNDRPFWTDNPTTSGACEADKQIGDTCCNPTVYAVSTILFTDGSLQETLGCFNGVFLEEGRAPVKTVRAEVS